MIVAKNLFKTFQGEKALHDINIQFESNNLHGIIGPDGAGKTTLIRLITGLLKPTSGSITYYSDGREIPFDTMRRSIAYMPSKACLYPDLSVEEHLIFFGNLYSLSKKEFEEKSKKLLSLTRLEPFRVRKASQLSGGMYKKLGLICALLWSPSVILLDEPTNGVDPISRREFWDLLHHLLENKILIIMSTSYMDEAERCTRVHFFDSGRLIKSGRPKQILEEENIPDFNRLFGVD